MTSLAEYGISKGWIKPAEKPAHQYVQAISPEQRARHNKRNLARYYAKRDAFNADGLTSQGKKRVREPRHNLKHLTPEQKLARSREQSRVWHRNQTINKQQ